MPCCLSLWLSRECRTFLREPSATEEKCTKELLYLRCHSVASLSPLPVQLQGTPSAHSATETRRSSPARLAIFPWVPWPVGVISSPAPMSRESHICTLWQVFCRGETSGESPGQVAFYRFLSLSVSHLTGPCGLAVALRPAVHLAKLHTARRPDGRARLFGLDHHVPRQCHAGSLSDESGSGDLSGDPGIRGRASSLGRRADRRQHEALVAAAQRTSRNSRLPLSLPNSGNAAIVGLMSLTNSRLTARLVLSAGGLHGACDGLESIICNLQSTRERPPGPEAPCPETGADI